jgi:YetA-like protein
MPKKPATTNRGKESAAKVAPISRRQFIRQGASNVAALPVVSAVIAMPVAAAQEVVSAPPADGALQATGAPQAKPAVAPIAPAFLSARGKPFAHFLDSKVPAVFDGATWGMPWPRGKHRDKTRFGLRDDAGNSTPVQSWPIAYWPDGSLKWTAHAIPADAKLSAGALELIAGQKSTAPAKPLQVNDTPDAIEIDTGVIRCRLARKGNRIIESVTRGDRELLRDGRLVLLSQDRADSSADGVIHQQAFESSIDRVTLEQRGPIRAVVKIDGKHANASRQWLPFTLRLYFYAGGESLRVLHTIIFDGNEAQDFIRGVGIRFATPMKDALHDRHVRFAGNDTGLFAEAVRGLTGLRRDPGRAIKQAQLAGTATPPVDQFPPAVGQRLELIPAFGDWTLLQSTADAFTICKRTREGFGWLQSDRGTRAAGLGYVGGPSGGIAFGIRNFWQSHPAQLDIRNAVTDMAEVTLWVWAPNAQPMDLRFYHDGLGQDTFEKQREGLEITYEDYEPEFGTPLGVARTSELRLWMLSATPARERLVELADALRAPPVIAATPGTLIDAGVFASGFSLPDRSTPAQAQIEDHLDWMFDFYRRQQDERSWYGFWNYGDVMHTYDADRHVWRYDVGGFAWDNSELSTDIWLWLYFLRTGRADVFRFAEAMTRHTGEVDVHHIGRFAPLGSRHNVQHWGCSAKQLRISTALNRRYYYYLTADERVGDLMREQIDADRTLRTIEPNRKVPGRPAREAPDPNGDFAYIGFGTDWGSLAGAWLTEWERTRNKKVHDKLVTSMRTIAAQPKGFFTGSGRMNLTTGAFDISKDAKVSVSHLSAAFGLPEVCSELVELVAMPEFERAWLQYCELYNATPEAQKQALGEPLESLNLQQGHARLTAFAAHRKKDAGLGRRAWQEFHAGRAGYSPRITFQSQRVTGPAVLNPVDEAVWLSTNSTAQWGLAAIECLAFARDALTG